MSVINGTFNQIVKGNSKFGGTLVVFEGKPELLVGGFNFNLDDLPAAGDVLPCGTPVYCDEQARTITPVITAKIAAVDATDNKVITLADNGFAQTALKVGDVVGLLPANLANAASAYAQVAAKEGNVITLSASIQGAAADGVLAVVDGTSHKVKAVPNALLPYDVVRDAAAISVDGDGMWSNDRPILERRMPPVNDAIKEALAAAGCQFRWSNRK